MTLRKDPLFDLDLNKTWDETDWERFFQIQDGLMLARERQLLNGRRRCGVNPKALRKPYCLNLPKITASHAPGDFCDDEWTPGQIQRFWEDGAALELVPVYCQSYAFVERVSAYYALCIKLGRKRSAKYQQKILPLALNLQLSSLKLLADMAQGHCLGYDSIRIAGNIARCKRALRHAETCMRLAGELHKVLRSKKEAVTLFSRAAKLRNALVDWIDDLRTEFIP